jgi:hypothetical protein
MPRFILSELDLPMGQFKVFTIGDGNTRVLCVHDRLYFNQYYGFYRSVAVL